MLIHTRSIAHKTFDIWRSPGRFTKNPEIVVLPTGRMLLIYSDTDAHWSMKSQVLTLLASDDQGQTWFKHREIDRADLTAGDERLVTPRLSILNDGRLVVIIDHNDDGHFHETQAAGNWLYWSSDNGDSHRRDSIAYRPRPITLANASPATPRAAPDRPTRPAPRAREPAPMASCPNA